MAQMNKEFFNHTTFNGSKFPACPYTFRHDEDGEARQHKCWSKCPYFVKIENDGRGYCNFENETFVKTLVDNADALVNVLQMFQSSGTHTTGKDIK